MIRALRLRTKLTISQLSEDLGVNVSSVSRWETSTAKPAAEMMERLSAVLGATPEERACLIESGVAKIKVDRPPFNAEVISSQLKELEKRFLANEWTNLELSLLQLQSILWWYCEETPEAGPLLAWTITLYSEFLAKVERWADAALLAEAALALLNGEPGLQDLSALAIITLARCEVYGPAHPQPHAGLVMLNRWKEELPDGPERGRVFAEIAKYAAAVHDYECAARYAGESLRLASEKEDPRIRIIEKELREVMRLAQRSA